MSYTFKSLARCESHFGGIAWKGLTISTSEDLVVVLEKRLKTPILLFEKLQAFVLQQTSHLAHRKAAWREKTDDEREVQRPVTNKRAGRRSADAKFIRILKQRCGPAQNIFYSAIHGANSCSRQGRRDGGYIQNISHSTGKKRNPQFLSVSPGCELCSVKAALRVTSAFHRYISNTSSERVCHRRHSPTGTVILDSRQPERDKMGVLLSYLHRYVNVKKVCIHSTLHFEFSFWVFWLGLFPSTWEFNHGWPLVC